MNKRTRGTLLIALGVLLILAGGGLHALHERQDALAGQNSARLLDALAHEIRFNDSFLAESSPPVPSDAPAAPSSSAAPESPSASKPPLVTAAPESPHPTETSAMPSRTLAGYELIGVLRVPSVNIELPVLNDWSYSLLNIAPCRYSGSLEQGNLILLGHSYKSHLEPLEDVRPGDVVEFVDVNGTVHPYTVDTVDIIRGTDTDLLESDHSLILFTCTRDSSNRIVVRCVPAGTA